MEVFKFNTLSFSVNIKKINFQSAAVGKCLKEQEAAGRIIGAICAGILISLYVIWYV